jgi:excisionase family DNA binding protein
MAEWVSVTEAREKTGYSDRHIRLLLRENTIKGRKTGGIWLVDLDDLLQYKRQMDELGTKRYDPTRGGENC